MRTLSGDPILDGLIALWVVCVVALAIAGMRAWLALRGVERSVHEIEELHEKYYGKSK